MMVNLHLSSSEIYKVNIPLKHANLDNGEHINKVSTNMSVQFNTF